MQHMVEQTFSPSSGSLSEIYFNMFILETFHMRKITNIFHVLFSGYQVVKTKNAVTGIVDTFPQLTIKGVG